MATVTLSRKSLRMGSARPGGRKDWDDFIAVLNAIGGTGLNELITDHATFKTAVDSLVTLATELRTDHATFKTAADEVETLIEELHDDHATFKTSVDGIETLIEELSADHATFKTVVDDLKTLMNAVRKSYLYNVFGNPGFLIDTNFDVKNATAVYYSNGGTLKTLAANANFDTGTAATFPTVTWASALLSVDASGNGVVTWFTNAGAGYASEAAAIADLTAAAATETAIGYITVLAAGAQWLAGTDALEGGTGGTPATTTNYYNSINPNATEVGAAVSSSSPATLSTANPASAPATLAAPKPASAPATITAAAPSAGPATLTAGAADTLAIEA
jgi:hypothetical protein